MGHWSDPLPPPTHKRAKRRWTRARKVARVLKWLYRWWPNGYPKNTTYRGSIELDARRMADNPKWCGHYYCNCQNFGPSFGDLRREAAMDSKSEEDKE